MDSVCWCFYGSTVQGSDAHCFNKVEAAVIWSLRCTSSLLICAAAGQVWTAVVELELLSVYIKSSLLRMSTAMLELCSAWCCCLSNAARQYCKLVYCSYGLENKNITKRWIKKISKSLYFNLKFRNSEKILKVTRRNCLRCVNFHEMGRYNFWFHLLCKIA